MSELLKRRKRLSDIEVKCYLLQLVRALEYLHSNSIIHRDLKLGNLFLSGDMHVKVGDFGLATKVNFEGERKKTVCGTPNYIAPGTIKETLQRLRHSFSLIHIIEILEGKEGHSYEVDIWSTGVVMYTLLVGKPPFESKDVKSTYKRILSNAYNFPEMQDPSDHARGLIRMMLQVEYCFE